jgi:hypothetical protein
VWFKQKNQEAAGRPGGIEFDAAAARVTAESPEIPAGAEDGLPSQTDSEALIIKPEWAIAAVKGAFYPAEKFLHPAYAVDDEEAAEVSPKMQVFLQSLADKYAPAAISRLANRYPEFWDLAAALGVLYYQKWRVVSKLIAQEEKARAAAGENAKRVNAEVVVMPSPAEQPEEELQRKVVGERMRDGSLVI